MFLGQFLWFFKVPGWFFTVPDGFYSYSWFQAGFFGSRLVCMFLFSRFLGGLLWFQVFFGYSRFQFGCSWFHVGFYIVPGRFFMVPGQFSWFFKISG